MSDSKTDPNVSRRDFITKAVVFTGAGLAIGSVAAVGKNLLDQTLQTSDEPSADFLALQSQLADATLQITQLQGALTASDAELNDLRPKYAESLSKQSELLNVISTTQQEAGTATAALAEAQAKIDKLNELVAMYDKLEDGNSLDTLIRDGFTAASASFAGALGILPLVTEGVDLARQLLDGLDFQIPNYRAGLGWLQKRMDEMNSSIASVEQAIKQALKSLDPVTAAMSQLVTYILQYLPATVGAGVKGALDAVDILYQSLPPVVTGTHDQVINMLGEPFADNDKGISNAVVKPIRERSLSQSEKLVVQVNTTNEAYTAKLEIPVLVALEQRKAVQKEIADFRATHKI
jgi:peptidoglycan hydrolase CwlO-like protein